MAVGGEVSSGRTTVAFLGFGNTAAYVVGALILGVGLSRRTKQSILSRGLVRATLVAAPIGLVIWLVVRAIEPAGRAGNLAVLVVSTILGGGAYLLGIRALGGVARLRPTPAPDDGRRGWLRMPGRRRSTVSWASSPTMSASSHEVPVRLRRTGRSRDCRQRWRTTDCSQRRRDARDVHGAPRTCPHLLVATRLVGRHRHVFG